MTKRTQFFSGVELFIERDGKLLLLRRSPTNAWGAGLYSLVGGHADGAESMESVAARELREELGVKADPKDFECIHVAHRYRDDAEYIIFFFKVLQFKGEPYNAEPDKHSELLWVDKNAIPTPMVDELIVKAILEGKAGFYSSWGFGI